MIKSICFFSKDFAFNRQVRMRFYEETFPEDVKIYLFTTKKNHQNWNLNRTIIKSVKYNPFKLGFQLRKFSRKNNIERFTNLGSAKGMIFIFLAKILTKKDYLINFTGESLTKYKYEKRITKKIAKFLELIPFFTFGLFAHKITFVGRDSYRRSKVFFFLSRTKEIIISHAPVNTKLFYPKSKKVCRKKWGIPQNKKVLLRVGRINLGKGADLIKNLINENKDVYFILVGKINKREISLGNYKNLKVIKSIPHNELVDLYSAADISFCLHRSGDQMGLVAIESLACGCPIIQTNTVLEEKSPAIFKSGNSINELNQILKKFFRISISQRKSLSKDARGFAIENFSYDFYRDKYNNFYLSD